MQQVKLDGEEWFINDELYPRLRSWRFDSKEEASLCKSMYDLLIATATEEINLMDFRYQFKNALRILRVNSGWSK